jgi:hypothetical protein
MTLRSCGDAHRCVHVEAVAHDGLVAQHPSFDGVLCAASLSGLRAVIKTFCIVPAGWQATFANTSAKVNGRVSFDPPSSSFFR